MKRKTTCQCGKRGARRGAERKPVWCDGQWYCETCQLRISYKPTEVLHLPPVKDISLLRTRALNHAGKEPTTLCGEHTHLVIGVDDEITCTRCVAMVAKRPQLWNWIRSRWQEATG